MTVRKRGVKREQILSLFEARTGLSRSEVGVAIDISYWSARYWLEKLSSEGLIRKEVIERGKLRRIFYFTITPIKEYFYRTQLALLFYSKVPRGKTPDPIAEFRCTVVSDKQRQYNIDEFKMNCVYVGVILAPQTFWNRPESFVSDKPKVENEVVAYELDEPIDKDELKDSVKIYRKLNFAERQAIFFKSRQREMWRAEHQYWWLEKVYPKGRMGDYLYTEDIIKTTETNRVNLTKLKLKFNNNTGRMESV